MPKRVEALVEPKMLVWARRTSGYNPDEIARKARIDVEWLGSWERGEARPSIAQLRALARIYRRPLAAFYLPEPPKDFTIPHDFRRLPDQQVGTFSPHLLFEMRQATYRRDVALELYSDLGEEPPQFGMSVSLDDAPEQAARRFREMVNISHEVQSNWNNNHVALNGWRAALEELGILVFQAPMIDVSEMRGFSITDRPLPVIVVNSADAVRGRIFSMVHELVHVALGDHGLCNIMDSWLNPSRGEPIEVFCNRVAGAILVPEDDILNEPEVKAHTGEVIWADDAVETLANRYNVSRETILRRLLLLGRTTERFYQEKRVQYRDEYSAYREKKRNMPIPRDRIAVARVGRLFTRLVISSYYSDRITGGDVTRYLDVALKHVPAMRDAVFNLR